MAALRIGLAGLGTVGTGVARLLAANADLIATRAERPVVLTAVCARDPDKVRDRALGVARWHDDPLALVADPAVDALVEVIGGTGIARAAVTAAIAAGKPVVTANKALIAEHGASIVAAAEAANVPIAFEAAVAGGIPVLKTIREGLAANRITHVAGILNGTCNYILTEMRRTGRAFADVLADAQALGYAEADPAFDIDGIDTAHKLAILAALAFQHPVPFDAIHVEGIRDISALDIAFADEFGFRVKLLGIAGRRDGGIEARVHPCMVPATSPLAAVEGVYNAVAVEADQAGRVMLEGRGAGAGPTASAVVADLIDIARGRATPAWGAPLAALHPAPVLPMTAHVGAYYLRLTVRDRPGVIADVTAALRDQGISLRSMLQRGRGEAAVPVELVTHETGEAAMRAALARVAAIEAVTEPPAMIRIENG